MRAERADEAHDTSALHGHADVLVRRWLAETRVPDALPFRKDVAVEVLVAEIASIRAAPVLRVKASHRGRVLVVRRPIFDHVHDPRGLTITLSACACGPLIAAESSPSLCLSQAHRSACPGSESCA